MPRSATPLPAALLLAILLSACAGGETPSQPAASGMAAAAPPAAAAKEAATPAPPITPGDPLEPLNRRILDVNLWLDDTIIKPAALLYRDALGPWPRRRIRNVLANMQEPRFLANHLLQGRPLAAGETLMRFVINSTG